MEFDELKKQLLKELNDDNLDNYSDLKSKVDRVITVSSSICAAVAFQPIPFADFPILTSIEAIMVMKIGNLYGFNLTKERSLEIVKELAGVVGLGWLAKNAILIGYKTFIPFAGGFFTMPLVFGACFGIGQIANLYFKNKRDGVPFDVNKAKELFKEAKSKSKDLYEKYKNEKDKY